MEGNDGGKKSPYFNTNFTVNYDLTQDSFLAFAVTNILMQYLILMTHTILEVVSIHMDLTHSISKIWPRGLPCLSNEILILRTKRRPWPPPFLIIF